MKKLKTFARKVLHGILAVVVGIAIVIWAVICLMLWVYRFLEGRK